MGRLALVFLMVWSLLAGLLLPDPGHMLAGPAPANPPSAGVAQKAAAAQSMKEPQSWLLKWKPGQEKPLSGTEVISRQTLFSAVDVVQPANPEGDIGDWLRKLRQTPGVAYVEPSGPVSLLAAASTNDPELPKQHFLDQIGAKEAWSTLHDQTDLTIALVDTGVDLNHPDLKDNLVEGTNLVRPGTAPQDDNGHGTAVAGVLAGAGNNKLGIAGILWKAKIMPIKALDEDGYGDEERLGEAILYAVKKGAKIVVLSVGLYRYSPYMKDIAMYAESKGVLLVAASGNDGKTLGAKAKVKYPAAYPSVLAVGGVSSEGQPEPRSNNGPEIDIAAPWSVYTTAVGGGYTREEGTSMSAPQAAAAAALIWAVHPDFKPYQIREMLRQSAKDIGKKGVDEAAGYGLLRIDRATSTTLKADAYEPNNSRDKAAVFPLGTKIAAEMAGHSDRDWYVINAPYDGVLSIQFQGITAADGNQPSVTISHYAGDEAQSVKETKLGNETGDWKVKKGNNYFELRLSDRQNQTVLPYLLTSTFQMSPDAYEKNDKQYSGFTLAPRSQTIVGNFHQSGDRDWYTVHFETGGTLKLTLSTDSVRIDPSLSIQRQDGPLLEVDENGEGVSETSELMSVTPGTYYFRVYNAMSAQASPVPGQYTMTMDFRTKYTDPNEPNNKAYEATVVSPGSDYVGVMGNKQDVDWYQLRLAAGSVVSLKVNGIPAGTRMKAVMMDKRQKALVTLESKTGESVMTTEKKLEAGLYYIKLTASAPFDKQYYRLRIDTDQMVAGYRDISGHWAESAIVALNKKGIIAGSGAYKFRPDASITRAEAVSMLVRAFKLPKGGSTGFKDVPAKHWAAGAIAQAVAARLASGYLGGVFGPDRFITREEMAAMLVRALKLGTAKPPKAPYNDVELSRWSAPSLSALKQKGIIGGYPGQQFKPEQTASRAEFASLLLRALK
ncbi:hypothetical protein GCM10010911_58970 [Paenibacillus nasutitermitis]|uniref:SLH domain-containing protein n=1 Tax=Paenibacillus nasutitermitis TaxID=1652958 RepID=A0A917E1I7_9BACL|nr:hypothetical protein GCM10010911_58970 [Paenibacillus nasutitermitis]